MSMPLTHEARALSLTRRSISTCLRSVTSAVAPTVRIGRRAGAGALEIGLRPSVDPAHLAVGGDDAVLDLEASRRRAGSCDRAHRRLHAVALVRVA